MAEAPTISEALERASERSRARILKSTDAYALNAELEEAPTRPEVVGWYVYGLCSYFVQSFLLPILFPLMVAQRAVDVSDMPPPPTVTSAGLTCHHRNASALYQMLVHKSIRVPSTHLSPLHWTAISWFAGIIVAAPILRKIAHSLDHSYHQPLILGSGTAAGAFICLLTGFFKTTWLFPFYIIFVTVAITAASATHTRHLGLIARGLTGDTTQRKTTATSQMSLLSTSLGSIGTAIIALFTFHMLRRTDHLTSLWVVSIFCGLKWFLGIFESFFANRPGSPSASLNLLPSYNPFVIGRLAGVLLSSFSSTCIFTSMSLYVVGALCIKPAIFLTLWMVYFFFAAIMLPALHPVQRLLRAEAVKMNVLGFLLTAVASGVGFYFRHSKWHWVQILLVSLVQSVGAGILHAFGRVMILEPSPAGKEGVFAALYEWVKITGACGGFALAAAFPDDIRVTFGLSFVAVFVAIVVLIFGSEVRGFGRRQSEGQNALNEESEGASSENGLKKGEQSREYIGTGSNLDGGNNKQVKLGEGSLQA